MYQMKFNVKALVVEGSSEENVEINVNASEGDVFVSFEDGTEVQLTPTQAKDLMFSLRKAVYEAQRETREKKEEFEVEPCAICGKKPHFSRSAAGHVLFCSFCLTYLGMEIRTKPKNSERSAVLVWNTAMENARGLKEEKRRAAK